MSIQKKTIKEKLNSLHLPDIYSLILFILYKMQDIPEYAVLSELCYLLDGANITRLLTYFAGKTIKFPTEDEFATLANALLLYQYINVDGDSLADAQMKLGETSSKKRDAATEMYLKIVPIMNQYNIDRGQVQHD